MHHGSLIYVRMQILVRVFHYASLFCFQGVCVWEGRRVGYPYWEREEIEDLDAKTSNCNPFIGHANWNSLAFTWSCLEFLNMKFCVITSSTPWESSSHKWTVEISTLTRLNNYIRTAKPSKNFYHSICTSTWSTQSTRVQET